MFLEHNFHVYIVSGSFHSEFMLIHGPAFQNPKLKGWTRSLPIPEIKFRLNSSSASCMFLFSLILKQFHLLSLIRIDEFIPEMAQALFRWIIAIKQCLLLGIKIDNLPVIVKLLDAYPGSYGHKVENNTARDTRPSQGTHAVHITFESAQSKLDHTGFPASLRIALKRFVNLKNGFKCLGSPEEGTGGVQCKFK